MSLSIFARFYFRDPRAQDTTNTFTEKVGQCVKRCACMRVRAKVNACLLYNCVFIYVFSVLVLETAMFANDV